MTQSDNMKEQIDQIPTYFKVKQIEEQNEK